VKRCETLRYYNHCFNEKSHFYWAGAQKGVFMTIRERGNATGNVASCESNNAVEHHGDARGQTPSIPVGEKGKSMSKRKRKVGCTVESVEQQIPKEASAYIANAYEKGSIVTTDQGVTLVDEEFLAPVLYLTRDAKDRLSEIEYCFHLILETLRAFPAPIRFSEKDYWVLDDVGAWIINSNQEQEQIVFRLDRCKTTSDGTSE